MRIHWAKRLYLDFGSELVSACNQGDERVSTDPVEVTCKTCLAMLAARSLLSPPLHQHRALQPSHETRRAR